MKNSFFSCRAHWATHTPSSNPTVRRSSWRLRNTFERVGCNNNDTVCWYILTWRTIFLCHQFAPKNRKRQTRREEKKRPKKEVAWKFFLYQLKKKCSAVCFVIDNCVVCGCFFYCTLWRKCVRGGQNNGTRRITDQVSIASFSSDCCDLLFVCVSFRGEELERAIPLVPRNGSKVESHDPAEEYDPHIYRKVAHPTS